MKADQSTDNPSAQWARLVTAATLGIDRAGVEPSALGGGVEPIFSDTPASDPAEAVLDRLAALSLYTLAGSEHEPIQVVVEPIEDDLTPCSAGASAVLHAIVHAGHGSLLDEWCALAGDRGQGVPAALLPGLLDLVSKGKRKRRDDVAAVLGRRGRWLAGQNPRWSSYAAAVIADTDQAAGDGSLIKQWETGQKAERIEAMQAMRQADPAQARELLFAGLAQESAADRAAFTRTLAIGLSADDEASLEQLLDDRSVQVRDAAAELLSIIPGSALSARMVARLEASVAYTPAAGMLRKKPATLELNLPNGLDDQAPLDSIVDKAAQGMGAKAAALSRVVALAPLSWWEAKGLDAAKWVALALSSEWRLPLVLGWAQAVKLQNKPAWSAALVDQVCLQPAERKDQLTDYWRSERLGELVEQLPNDQLLKLVDAHLPRQPQKQYSYRLVELLRACPGPWDVDLSQRVLAFLRQAVQHKEVVYDSTLRSFIDNVAAARIAIALGDTVDQGWPTDAKHWSANFEELIDRFVRTVRLREQMHTAFTTTT